MRLWSLHPKYLDSHGLVALWREALLAQAVLRGKTKGYRHHPQLLRFRASRDPVAAIGAYLMAVHDEAASRGYHFSKARILRPGAADMMPVTKGQLAHEISHLLKKLRKRDAARYRTLLHTRRIAPNPLLMIVPGDIAAWEKVSRSSA
jgi:hypothetical protein